MKYVISEDICEQHGLTISEVLCILACKSSENIYDLIADMQERELLSKQTENPYPTMHWDDEVCRVLLESDRTVPVVDRCQHLAETLREMFPKGFKIGTHAWRGNIREITLRLQKFFKIYGNKWTDDEIIEATRKYITHFNGDYTYMRILKYFIMKSDRVIMEDGSSHIEDISELATWLENNSDVGENSSDWLADVR